MQTYLDFEKGLAEIEGKAEELRAMGRKNSEMKVEEEAEALDRKASTLLEDLYKNLDPWRKCQVARHPDRPHCRDYVEALFTRVAAAELAGAGRVLGGAAGRAHDDGAATPQRFAAEGADDAGIAAVRDAQGTSERRNASLGPFGRRGLER